MAAHNIREASLEDLDRCFEIESISYQGDEAASKEKIATRIENYPQGFIVLEIDGVIAGFINSGACHNVVLSDEEFKELIGHDPEGKHIVIMSVVVHPDYQRIGLATRLMQSFITKMEKLNKSSIHLICQTELINMYANFGFNYQCESESDHGGMQWHEMVIEM